MDFFAVAETDTGIQKNVNQDSLLVKHADTPMGEVLLAVVCDGMGGLSRGELASATAIRAFSAWFERELPTELSSLDIRAVGQKWEGMLQGLNKRLFVYGAERGIHTGTTFSGILFVDDMYVIGHVGDTRIYHIGNRARQLTQDQTVTAREVREGRMTPRQARADVRRSVLLQCVGGSGSVTPQILYGRTKQGVYVVCSDGFWHEVGEGEMCERFRSPELKGKWEMRRRADDLIRLVKSRNERDNISVILIRAGEGQASCGGGTYGGDRGGH